LLLRDQELRSSRGQVEPCDWYLATVAERSPISCQDGYSPDEQRSARLPFHPTCCYRLGSQASERCVLSPHQAKSDGRLHCRKTSESPLACFASWRRAPSGQPFHLQTLQPLHDSCRLPLPLRPRRVCRYCSSRASADCSSLSVPAVSELLWLPRGVRCELASAGA
jgi:hypothetical protein